MHYLFDKHFKIVLWTIKGNNNCRKLFYLINHYKKYYGNSSYGVDVLK